MYTKEDLLKCLRVDVTPRLVKYWPSVQMAGCRSGGKGVAGGGLREPEPCWERRKLHGVGRGYHVVICEGCVTAKVLRQGRGDIYAHRNSLSSSG